MKIIQQNFAYAAKNYFILQNSSIEIKAKFNFFYIFINFFSKDSEIFIENSNKTNSSAILAISDENLENKNAIIIINSSITINKLVLKFIEANQIEINFENVSIILNGIADFSQFISASNSEISLKNTIFELFFIHDFYF